jgi:hypothetical protein
MKDVEWIPQVARAGLAIITRDRRIQDRIAEKDTVVASNAKMFAITSPEQLQKMGSAGGRGHSMASDAAGGRGAWAVHRQLDAYVLEADGALA